MITDEYYDRYRDMIYCDWHDSDTHLKFRVKFAESSQRLC